MNTFSIKLRRCSTHLLGPVAGLCLLSACSTTDAVTGKKTQNLWSLEDDIKMGESMLADVRKWAAQENIPVNQDAAMVAELEHMMREIAKVSHLPDLPYEVLLIHSATVNAMAMPGGKFIVFEGLYDPEIGLVKNRNELAAVMAHEIAHVNCRHSTEALTRDLPVNLLMLGGMLYAEYREKEDLQLVFGTAFLFYNGLVVTKYSRKDEREADRVGLTYMAQAGYNPSAAVQLWQRAAEREGDYDRALSVLSTHPPSSERARDLAGRLPDAMLAYESATRSRSGTMLAGGGARNPPPTGTTRTQAPGGMSAHRPAGTPSPGAEAQPPGGLALRAVSPPASAGALHPAAVRKSDTTPASAAPPAPAAVKAQHFSLEVKTRAVRSGEKIVVVHSDFEITDKHAWIAFYEKLDARDEDYLSYTFLANLNDRTYDVIAPKKSGDEYHFRIFATEAYDCAARSERIQIK